MCLNELKSFKFKIKYLLIFSVIKIDGIKFLFETRKETSYKYPKSLLILEIGCMGASFGDQIF